MCILLAVALIVFAIVHYFRKKTKALEKKAEEEKELLNQVITAFATCIDIKDRYTRGHSFRVAAYTKMIAEQMGRFTDTEIENFYNIALLHDIGKILVPDNVLNKPGRLNDEEFVTMKQHAWDGYEILKEIIRLFDHQMHIERQAGPAGQALHDHRTEADIRNKMSVHHVHVDQMGTALFDAPDLLSQL